MSCGGDDGFSSAGVPNGPAVKRASSRGHFPVPEKYTVAKAAGLATLAGLYEQHEGAFQLDTKLAVELSQAVTGSWRLEFNSLPMRYCCMVEALVRKMRSAPSVQVASAISDLLGTTFTGGPMEFKTSFAAIVTTMRDCEVTIDDLINAVAVGAIGQRSKSTQADMLSQINTNLAARQLDPGVKPLDPIDLVTKSMLELEAVKKTALVQHFDGTPAAAGTSGQAARTPCGRCGRNNHPSDRCHAKRHAITNEEIKSPPTAKAPEGYYQPRAPRVQKIEAQQGPGAGAQLDAFRAEMKLALDQKKGKSKPRKSKGDE